MPMPTSRPGIGTAKVNFQLSRSPGTRALDGPSANVLVRRHEVRNMRNEAMFTHARKKENDQKQKPNGDA